MTDRTIVEAVKKEFREALLAALGRFPAVATRNDRYLALALAVRDRLLERWLATARDLLRERSRTVCYLSAEFLLGPAPGQQPAEPRPPGRGARRPWRELGLDLDELARRRRRSPGSATAASAGSPPATSTRSRRSQIPAIGYGIRYEFGIFDQAIRDGWQVEITDKWLRLGQPLGDRRARRSPSTCGSAAAPSRARDERRPLPRALGPGARGARASPTTRRSSATASNTANMLRLWKAEAAESFDFEAFNEGDYYGAVEEKIASENITKVLYPNDEPAAGQAAAARAAVLLRLLLAAGHDPHPPAEREATWTRFHEKYAVQLNDTHPAIAVAELMRLLVDEHGVGWDAAWEITAAHLRLHQPHAAARGAREVAGRRCSARCCRATSRSSTRSTAASSTRCARASRATRRAWPRAVADRRGGRALRADGAPRLRRQPRRQRRGARCTPSC